MLAALEVLTGGLETCQLLLRVIMMLLLLAGKQGRVVCGQVASS